jgi:hypothetical protein
MPWKATVLEIVRQFDRKTALAGEAEKVAIVAQDASLSRRSSDRFRSPASIRHLSRLLVTHFRAQLCTNVES